MPERAGMSLERGARSTYFFDDLDELFDAVALAPGEVDQLPGALDDDPTFGRSRNRDPTPPLSGSGEMEVVYGPDEDSPAYETLTDTFTR
jgi:hypothetical protein